VTAAILGCGLCVRICWETMGEVSVLSQHACFVTFSESAKTLFECGDYDFRTIRKSTMTLHADTHLAKISCPFCSRLKKGPFSLQRHISAIHHGNFDIFSLYFVNNVAIVNFYLQSLAVFNFLQHKTPVFQFSL
jgi:hypothetical protein